MTRIAVLLCGVAGMAIIARAAAFYRGTDSFAFGLVCLMALGLFLGLWELWQRSARVTALTKELDTLPKEPELETIDAATPSLRTLLRARLEREPMSLGGPIFTPFLIGLLVMLGLLGTFMGAL